ncbi:hypothetical protein O181_045780 [Austropuccinia psidii MF-1]|uniref:Uncharacterized protein n=1 Tax=Austropuccinia psidii MF-1 TaxID=1389203 RepID=A0A9Q3HLI6_9BASI|nr:hypothetical protein [Austropuccinia psidii MF-1]
MTLNEIYSSLPLALREKVTGHHHPYAFKPRTAHARSSRRKLWMMRIKTCLPITVKKMMNQGGMISLRMKRALSQIVSSPILNCPSPRVCLNNPRSDSKRTRLSKLTMWLNMRSRRSNKDG